MNNDDWLLLSMLFYLLIAVPTLIYVIKVKKAGFFDPAVQFLIFLTLFVLPLPLRAYMTKEIEGDVTEHLLEILPYMPIAVFMTAVSLPFFLWGYYSRFAERVASRLPRPQTGRNLASPAISLAIVSLFLLVQLASDSDGLLNFILLGYAASAEIYGKGHLAIGFPWMFVASLFLLYRYAVRRKKMDLALFVVAFILLGGMFLLMGSRNMIVYMGLTVALFWHYAVRPIHFKKLAVLGLTCFLALNVVGYLRTSNYRSLTDFWTTSASAYQESSTTKGRMLYTLTIGEFVVPFETLPQMIRSVGSEIPPQMGLTYVKDAMLWIPSVLFPDRPPTLTHWYMETFYGEGHGLNIGRSFFFLSEGYLNFGVLGVFATMLAWGVFLGIVRSYLHMTAKEPGAVLLCALTIGFIYRGLAGDFSSMFVGLPEQSLSAAVIGLWIANYGSHKKLWGNTSLNQAIASSTSIRQLSAPPSGLSHDAE
jgi:hypothetical protein